MKTSLRRSLTRMLLGSALIAGGILYSQAQKKPDPGAADSAPSSAFREMLTTDTAVLKRDGTMQKSYADVIDKIEPAVVKISTAQEFIVRRRRNSAFDDPFLRRFYGLPEQPATGPAYKARRELGLGSGVIVSRDGYILTNNHVIAEATEIKVFVPGREEPLDGKVVDSDPENDVAVVKVTAEDLPVAVLADSSQVRRGDIVFAVGAPFGYEQSVTMGIVSAVGRREVGVIGQGQENLIQTDAAINPGNSGGPLIDADGRVIGLNTAIYSNTGSTVNIGFAIPINRVVQVASSLVNPQRTGQVGYLGVLTDSVTQEIAKLLQLKDVHGAYVREVTKDSPAEAAGILVDDVILAFQGRRVESRDQLFDEIGALPAGREITLTVWRNGESKDLRVTLGDRKTSAAKSTLPDDNQGTDDAAAKPYGMKLTELTPKIRRALDLADETQGLVIEAIEKNSPAAGSGLSPGDLVLRINKMPVATVADAAQAFAKSREGLSLLHVWSPGTNTRIVMLREK